MVIPHRQLSDDALRGVIEEFVTREGTDYGGVSLGLAEKVQQVRDQLDRGDALVLYDRDSNSCTLAPAKKGQILTLQFERPASILKYEESARPPARRRTTRAPFR